MEPKLCKDKNCLEITYICITCKRVCCRHFCGNRDERGSCLCSPCILERQAKLIESDITLDYV